MSKGVKRNALTNEDRYYEKYLNLFFLKFFHTINENDIRVLMCLYHLGIRIS
jgi:hypothetical protein